MTDAGTHSLSELRDLVAKAACGAGLDWGLAEEAGWAAEWLARRGMPAAGWAALWLAARLAGQVSPVEVGIRLADSPRDIDALPDGLVAPGYLLPFLHRIAGRRGPVAVRSQQGPAALVQPDGQVVFGPCWQPLSNGWTCSIVGGTPSVAAAPSRPTVPRPTLEVLANFALRTTVPASDASRRGAGSATGDND